MLENVYMRLAHRSYRVQGGSSVRCRFSATSVCDDFRQLAKVNKTAVCFAKAFQYCMQLLKSFRALVLSNENFP